MKQRYIPEPKPLFLERMQKLLDRENYENYLKILKELPVKSIRCNKIKISPQKLKKRLEQLGWKISQPWKGYPEVMIVENDLQPGELGRSLEHTLGYFYIQELASMLPIIALKTKSNESFLDLCSAPGSKTTQAASEMQNTGSIIANEVSIGRLRILASNLEKNGVTNTIITKKEGVALCKKFQKQNTQFDKILVDAPCSGEGTLRSSMKTYSMWNINGIKKLSKIQKQLAESAFELLKPEGEMIYSTCTHAPEENEEVVNYLLKKYNDQIQILDVELPIKTKKGITSWEDKQFTKDVERCARVYPQDNNTEGFFVSKFRRVK